MRKKITAQGPKNRKSYTVTLPIEWVKKEKVDKARSVELNIIGNNIMISSDIKPEERTYLEAETYKGSLIKVLQGLYRAGVDEIKFTFNDDKLLNEALSISEKYLIGFEVIEHKKDYIIINDITKESEEDFKAILRRIFLLLLELSENKDNIQVDSIDKTLKKLTNYCQRILIMKGHAEFKKIPFYYMILDRLEKVADEFKWVSRLNLTKKQETNYKELCEKLREAYELFYKFDPSKYDKFNLRTYEIRNSHKIDSEVDLATMHLHNIARILNSLGGDIFIIKYDSKE